jgi:hypothetical protein
MCSAYGPHINGSVITARRGECGTVFPDAAAGRFRRESAGAAVSPPAAGTGRRATVPSTRAAAAGSTRAAAAGSTRAAAAGSWGGARYGARYGSLGSSAAMAGALVRRLVHASLRMRGRTSTLACGRGGGANSAPSSRLARADPTAAVRAPREKRRAVAYRPESQAQPPGPGPAREDRTRFGAQQEAKTHLMDSQLAWRDLVAKRLRACHEIPPALSLQ